MTMSGSYTHAVGVNARSKPKDPNSCDRGCIQQICFPISVRSSTLGLGAMSALIDTRNRLLTDDHLSVAEHSVKQTYSDSNHFSVDHICRGSEFYS